MRKPVLVSVSGMKGMGVSTACERVAFSLNKSGIMTAVVELGTRKLTEKFEDDWVLGAFEKMHVVLIKRHGFTHTAVKMRLTPNGCKWRGDSVRPDFAVLLSCDENTYAERENIRVRPQFYGTQKDLKLMRRDIYQNLEWCHWGTQRVVKFNTDGPLGRLYAAGNIKRLIMQELGYAKNAVT